MVSKIMQLDEAHRLLDVSKFMTNLNHPDSEIESVFLI